MTYWYLGVFCCLHNDAEGSIVWQSLAMRKFILIKFSYENGKDKCLILPYFIGPEVRPWNSNMKKMLGVRALCPLFRHLLFRHLLFRHLLFRHLLFPGPCHSLLKCCPSSSIEFQKISRQALLRWSQVRSLVMAFSNWFWHWDTETLLVENAKEGNFWILFCSFIVDC